MSRLVIWACRLPVSGKMTADIEGSPLCVTENLPLLTGKSDYFATRHKRCCEKPPEFCAIRGNLLATGFGSGLSPVVPGTTSSLAAIPWYLMTFRQAALFAGRCLGSALAFIFAIRRRKIWAYTTTAVWFGMNLSVCDNANGVADDGSAVGGRWVRYFPHSDMWKPR